MDNRQTLMHIANICSIHPKKMEQMEKVQSISFNCTSDDEVEIVCELYDNHICRVLITGTRSNMTITYNTHTLELCRKKYREIPWFTYGFRANCYEIFKLMEA